MEIRRVRQDPPLTFIESGVCTWSSRKEGDKKMCGGLLEPLRLWFCKGCLDKSYQERGWITDSNYIICVRAKICRSHISGLLWHKSLISLLNKDKSFKVNNKDKYHIMEYHGNITYQLCPIISLHLLLPESTVLILDILEIFLYMSLPCWSTCWLAELTVALWEV